jgi:hypothetical protein
MSELQISFNTFLQKKHIYITLVWEDRNRKWVEPLEVNAQETCNLFLMLDGLQGLWA